MDSKEISYSSKNFTSSELDNISKLWETTTAFWKSRSLYAVAKLNIPYYLLDGKKSTNQLSKLLNINEGHLYRIMRCLETIGIFKEVGPNVFENSEQSLLIAKNEYIRNAILSEGSDVHHRIWETIVDTIENGRSNAHKTLFSGATTLWEIQSNNPEYQNQFKKYMSGMAKNLVPFFVSISDFSIFNVVVDLGGSEGIFISEILKNNSNIKFGINFDIETVISNNLKKNIDPTNNDPRFKHIGGDFFKKVPEADCYTLKFIFHDWDDESSIKILECIGKSLVQGGKVYIFDQIIDSDNKSDDSYKRAVWMDAHMMQACNGKERTKEEWINMINLAGYKLDIMIAPYYLVISKK